VAWDNGLARSGALTEAGPPPRLPFGLELLGFLRHMIDARHHQNLFEQIIPQQRACFDIKTIMATRDDDFLA